MSKYLVNNGGLLPFDGDGMREYLVDECVHDEQDGPLARGLRAGSLLEVPRKEVKSIPCYAAKGALSVRRCDFCIQTQQPTSFPYIPSEHDAIPKPGAGSFGSVDARHGVCAVAISTGIWPRRWRRSVIRRIQ